MRFAALATGLFLALTGFVTAQTFDTPDALLEAFYEPYFNDQFPDNEAAFRSQALQALYDNDAQVTPEGEMGALSFDPYIQGQDFDIADFEIGGEDFDTGEPIGAATAVDGERTRVQVTFTNFGEARDLVYDLVFEGGGWKIDDVMSIDHHFLYRLSEIFAENAALYQ